MSGVRVYRVSGSGFGSRVYSLRFRVWGLGFRRWCLALRFRGRVYKVQGLEKVFRVETM